MNRKMASVSGRSSWNQDDKRRNLDLRQFAIHAKSLRILDDSLFVISNAAVEEKAELWPPISRQIAANSGRCSPSPAELSNDVIVGSANVSSLFG